jgi:hypothetical protein
MDRIEHHLFLIKLSCYECIKLSSFNDDIHSLGDGDEEGWPGQTDTIDV